jgi:hypothetical protein
MKRLRVSCSAKDVAGPEPGHLAYSSYYQGLPLNQGCEFLTMEPMGDPAVVSSVVVRTGSEVGLLVVL